MDRESEGSLAQQEVNHLVSRLQHEIAALREQLGSARGALVASHRALGLLAASEPLPLGNDDLAPYAERIARSVVGTIADGCTIDVMTPDGVQSLVVAHIDRAREEGLRDVARRDVARALPRAALQLPLRGADAPLGMLTIWSEEGRTLHSSELTSVQWLAHTLSVRLELRRLASALTESEDASDTLLSMVSHELRTPLATISMSVESSVHRIEASADELPRAWLVGRLQKVKKSVRRIDQLLHTFLGMSQIQIDRLVPDAQDTDLAALTASVVKALQDDFDWAGCRCSIEAARSERGFWDPVQLEIVLTNLLTNAIKYAPASQVDVQVSGDDEHAALVVRDHGPGIAPELVSKLFRRFSRLSSGGRARGFGLGLWIVKHFVEANGGTVTCDSTPGAGATFMVRLPRAGASSRRSS
jgi:signal transduction histidine kinase